MSTEQQVLNKIVLRDETEHLLPRMTLEFVPSLVRFYRDSGIENGVYFDLQRKLSKKFRVSWINDDFERELGL